VLGGKFTFSVRGEGWREQATGLYRVSWEEGEGATFTAINLGGQKNSN